MKKPKLTQWFKADIKPTRVGVYQANWLPKADTYGDWYAYWDGKEWGWMALNISEAVRVYKETDRRHKRLAWRGLAAKP